MKYVIPIFVVLVLGVFVLTGCDVEQQPVVLPGDQLSANETVNEPVQPLPEPVGQPIQTDQGVQLPMIVLNRTYNLNETPVVNETPINNTVIVNPINMTVNTTGNYTNNTNMT